MSNLKLWRRPGLHAAVVMTVIAGFYLGAAAAPALMDACHAVLTALGLPWSVPLVELTASVDKENEIAGLQDLLLFVPAVCNVAVHAAVLLVLGRRGHLRVTA